MTQVWRAAKPQMRSVIRSRWLISYFLFFLLVTDGLLRFTGGDARTLLSLVNITLFIVPLVTLVYGTIFLYSSRELVELLLAQPVKRRTVFAALYGGLAIPLMSALVAGLTIPFLFHGFGDGQRIALLTLTLGAAGLTAVFTGIAFCVALKFQDRLTGLGAALTIWFVLALLYDGALLFIIAIADFRHLLEEIEDLTAIAERRQEPTIPHDEAIAKLKRDGLLPDRVEAISTEGNPEAPA